MKKHFVNKKVEYFLQNKNLFDYLKIKNLTHNKLYIYVYFFTKSVLNKQEKIACAKNFRLQICKFFR